MLTPMPREISEVHLLPDLGRVMEKRGSCDVDDFRLGGRMAA